MIVVLDESGTTLMIEQRGHACERTDRAVLGAAAAEAIASTPNDRIERLEAVQIGVPPQVNDHDGHFDRYGATLTPTALVA